MNRPPPYPYRPGPPMHSPMRPEPPPGQRRPPSAGREGPYAPAQVLLGLIRQSENRYLTYRDLLRRQDVGFGQLQMDAQNMSIALGPRDPDGLARLSESLSAALGAAEMGKYLLEQACAAELFLQGELKRWLSGEAPLGLGGGYPGTPRPPQQLPQGYGAQQARPQGSQGPQGPEYFGPAPQGWYPQQGGYPQSAYGQAAPGQPPLVDLRDPKAAEEFMKRAQQMPTGPAPSYVPQPTAAPVSVQGPPPAAVAPNPSSAPASPPQAAPVAAAPQNGVAQKGA